jgi:hypothetical protein
MVIDWESRNGQAEQTVGPPLCDLFYFVTYWLHIAYRLYDEDAELRAFEVFVAAGDRRDRVAQAVHEALAVYMARLDLDPGFLPLLLVYTWVRRALHQVEREGMLGTPDTASSAGNRYTGYVRALAECATQLFASPSPLCQGAP